MSLFSYVPGVFPIAADNCAIRFLRSSLCTNSQRERQGFHYFEADSTSTRDLKI